MRKRDWLIVLLPLLATWGLDRVTKLWATQLVGVKSFGPIGFVLHHNYGAMLGLFSDLPAVLRVVSLSTGGAFLVCTFALIQYLLPIKSLILRSGMSILLGGILGNVADRIVWGYIVDFIVVGNVSMTSPAFNVADALQWVGYAMIVYALIREGELLWPEKELRKTYWINWKFQLKYCLILVAVGLGLSLIGIVFSYTYLRVTIIELVGSSPTLVNRFLIPFVLTYIVMSLAFCTVLFAIGRILSHRTAGPLYAFEKYLEDLISGNKRNFKLRAGDDFKHLEALAEKIRVRVQKDQDSSQESVTVAAPAQADSKES
ncbi:MAG: signal peptidase II [Pseudobdellovibrionaceae bacterium]